ADRAAVELHQLPGDGQSQAQPRMLSAGHRFSLLEAIEHQRQEVGTNTYAGVANDDLHGAAVPGQLDLDGSARRGELHGVIQQIQYHRLNPIRIGALTLPPRTSADQRRMVLSGVRSSWLTVEMKSSLAWLALSALRRNSSDARNAWCRCSRACLSSV